MKKKFFAPVPLEWRFDPTGAGDTFAGGFAGFITQLKIFISKLWKPQLFKVQLSIILRREIRNRQNGGTKKETKWKVACLKR
jgi:sugar/nucleoside kinase (ribokinase family)